MTQSQVLSWSSNKRELRVLASSDRMSFLFVKVDDATVNQDDMNLQICHTLNKLWKILEWLSCQDTLPGRMTRTCGTWIQTKWTIKCGKTTNDSYDTGYPSTPFDIIVNHMLSDMISDMILILHIIGHCTYYAIIQFPEISFIFLYSWYHMYSMDYNIIEINKDVKVYPEIS